MKLTEKLFAPLLTVVLLTAGCSSKNVASNADTTGSIVMLSITSDYEKNPQAVDMALKFAGFALAEKRTVAIFFSVKGVLMPTKNLKDDFAFAENEPLKKQLTDLIEKGIEVHVCPICMKALKIEAADLIEGAEVTTRPKLFSKIGSNTAVFTY